jgi:hypothetical protein
MLHRSSLVMLRDYRSWRVCGKKKDTEIQPLAVMQPISALGLSLVTRPDDIIERRIFEISRVTGNRDRTERERRNRQPQKNAVHSSRKNLPGVGNGENGAFALPLPLPLASSPPRLLSSPGHSCRRKESRSVIRSVDGGPIQLSARSLPAVAGRQRRID